MFTHKTVLLFGETGLIILDDELQIGFLLPSAKDDACLFYDEGFSQTLLV